jgi:hypothetical protein
MLVVLEASFPSSLLFLLQMMGRAWWLCWRRPTLLLTLLVAGEEEGMLVVLEAFSPSSLLCLVRVMRWAWW